VVTVGPQIATRVACPRAAKSDPCEKTSRNFLAAVQLVASVV
jgi:hypothetical protein